MQYTYFSSFPISINGSLQNTSPHQSAIAPPLPPVQREHEIPVQSTPAAGTEMENGDDELSSSPSPFHPGRKHKELVSNKG